LIYANSITPEYRVKVGRGVPRLGFLGDPTIRGERKVESSSDRVSGHMHKAFRNQRHPETTPRLAIVGARV